MISRRKLIGNSLAGSAVISLSGAVPQFLLGASYPASQMGGDKILVVVQLTGGNDGLNTIVPYADDDYYKNRFTLAIGKNQILKIDKQIGFHPSMTGFSELLQDGKLAIVQGVGYPNPNRSHFESMDLWHTAHRVAENRELGWLGRTIDDNLAKQDLPALHFGSGFQPLALRNVSTPVPSIRSGDDFRLKIFRDAQSRNLLQQHLERPPALNNSLLGYVHESASVAVATSQRLENLDRNQNTSYGYPPTDLGRNLRSIAKLIGSGLKTRIYYTTLDGFDTHSNQSAAHAGLLGNFSNSVNAFVKELAAQGNADRVAVFGFSEFGRRVRENASAGTDHGTAAPVFVVGSTVKAGPIGDHPRLDRLQDGDLKYLVDYRSVYAELLESWLGVNANEVIGKQFKPTSIFA